MSHEKKIIIIAGPNGAGKTTFATTFLQNEAHCNLFVNADLIAYGLSPFNANGETVRAGKLMIKQINSYVEEGKSFAFETTLSGLSYSRKIPQWKILGYYIELVFLRLDTPETAINRVAARVKQGGHFVPDEVVKRRFSAGLRNFEGIYSNLVNEWSLYDTTNGIVKLSSWRDSPNSAIKIKNSG